MGGIAMWKQILPGLRIKLFMTVLLGVGYPLLVTGICRIVFPHAADGSLITAGGRIVGSELIGQNFRQPEYFHPRPSAAGNDGYDAASSGGSNLGPTSAKLIGRVRTSIEAFRRDNPDYRGPVPADLLTVSASGLDPHISPDAARAQARRIALARGVALDHVTAMIAEHTEGRTFGLLGEPRINVLKLNLAMDERLPGRSERK
jgi:K+-transporting ATPase ATPase C chain